MLSLVTSIALAQDTASGFDAHGFRLATAGTDARDPFTFVRPGNLESLQWSLGAVAEYAMRPLLFESADGETRTEALRDVVALDLAGGFVPVDPVRIDLSMPVYLTTGGEAAGWPAAGDLRASLLIAGLQPENAGGFGVGLVAALDVPTGDPERYLGTDGVAGLVGASGTMERDGVALSWLLGGRVAPNTQPDERPAATRGGDTVEAAGSIGYVAEDTLGVGVEARVSVPVDEAVRTAIGIPAEAMVTGRYHTGSGGFLSGGLGVGLGQGAGASPVRLVVGGGFGTRAEEKPSDIDGDGFDDRAEACPDQPETPNGFLDADGCPDALPKLAFVAGDPAAALTVTKAGGEPVTGTGRIEVEGMPGEAFTATATMPGCRGGVAEGRLPADGVQEVPVEIVRQEGQVAMLVTDAAGRPLEDAVVRYLVDDEACGATDSTLRGGRGLHTIGAGPVRIFVTATGYGVHQGSFEVAPGEREAVEVKLDPTQVRLQDGELKLSVPIAFTEAAVDAKSMPLVQQVVSVILSAAPPKVEVVGYADSRGAMKLAQQRAEAVVALLVSLGVPPTQLSTRAVAPMPKGQKELVHFKVIAQP